MAGLGTRDLCSRLERSAAEAAAEQCAALADASPGTGASWRPFGPGALVAFGTDRYVNRAIGLGDALITPDEIAELESFFAERGLPPSIEVASWASSSLLDCVRAGRYAPIWFRHVFVRRPGRAPQLPRRIELRPVETDAVAEWQRILALGNELHEPAARARSDEYASALRHLPDSIDLLARLDGESAGCGSIHFVGGVAWLGGAATLPQFRDRGIQSALVAHRLDLAFQRGSEWAAATALPGGASARNLERLGFTLAYAQLVVVGPTPTLPSSTPQ